MSRAPWITLALVALSVLLDLDPATWQIDRVAAGEPWRWATGHLVHWNPSHRLWDVAVVLVFGVALERTSRRTLGEVVLAAMLASSAMFAAMYDDLDTYRGLSGVACGLVAACGMTSLRRGDRVAGTALLLGLFGKIAVESLATGPMFAGGGFMNVPGVHLAGALSGVLAVAWRRATRRTRG